MTAKRPPRAKHSSEARDIALASYAASGSWRHAARMSGVPEPTIRRWAKADPQRVARLEDEAHTLIGDEVRRVLARAIDLAAAKLDEPEASDLPVSEITRVVRDLASASGRLADRAAVREHSAREWSAFLRELEKRDPDLSLRMFEAVHKMWPGRTAEPEALDAVSGAVETLEKLDAGSLPTMAVDLLAGVVERARAAAATRKAEAH